MFERKKSAGKIYFLPIDQIHPSPFQRAGPLRNRSWQALPRASVKMVCCSPSRCVKQPKVTSWWQGSGGCAPASWPR